MASWDANPLLDRSALTISASKLLMTRSSSLGETGSCFNRSNSS